MVVHWIRFNGRFAGMATTCVVAATTTLLLHTSDAAGTKAHLCNEKKREKKILSNLYHIYEQYEYTTCFIAR
jgi:uncharacterized tellurite resistance protein B-like protein